MSPISFFTPIESQDKLDSFIDDYFYLCGKKAVILNRNELKAVLLDSNQSFTYTLLKVISYCTVILPIVMLVAKIIFRCTQPTYEIDEQRSTELQAIHDRQNQSELARLNTQIIETPIPEETLQDFHARKGLLENPGKEIITPDELNKLMDRLSDEINWEETMNLSLTGRPEYDCYVQTANAIPFRQAMIEVVAKINEQIKEQAQAIEEVDWKTVIARYPTVQQKRFVLVADISTELLGDHANFYRTEINGKSWVDRILQILVESGHIFRLEGDEFQA